MLKNEMKKNKIYLQIQGVSLPQIIYCGVNYLVNSKYCVDTDSRNIKINKRLSSIVAFLTYFDGGAVTLKFNCIAWTTNPTEEFDFYMKGVLP